jgi:acetaldehyde/propanal dehydrogenase
MSVAVAILGSGNIGTDLLVKTLRSSALRPVAMVGIDPNSEGLARARQAGLWTTTGGIDALAARIPELGVRIAFDATSASSHAENVDRLAPAGITVVDMTPAARGPFCVPCVNLDTALDAGVRDVSLISCGGQATIPIVAAVASVQPVEYAEIIATIASKSAGPGTRRNIDEFTRTTARGIELVGGAARGKAIIILNPAEPPLVMRDTVHCLVQEAPDEHRVREAIRARVDEVRRYVPGYRVVNGPVFDGRRVSVYLEVQGRGDYLPDYAGNLDIMTCAGVRTGEVIAERLAAADARERAAQ